MKRYLTEGWAFVAVAAIAFVAGLLIGDLGGSSNTETVHVSSPSTAGEETGEPETAGANSPGAQVFTSTNCGSCHTLAAAGSTGTIGPDLNEFLAPDDDTQAVEEMIVAPNSEVAEGYPPNIMPKNYNQTLSPTEIHQLADYLVATTPAKPSR